jgi:ferric-dicitrate binding protein FerR (iron transport regulator)
MRLMEDAEVEIADPPARLFSGEILVVLRAGELLGAPRPVQPDLPMRIAARDADVEVAGGAFTAMIDPAFTSIGAWDGTVTALSHGDDARRLQIPSGHKILFHLDGSVSDTLALDPIERQALQSLAGSGSLD